MTDSLLLKRALPIWETLLTNPMPVVGHWGQKFAVNMLSELAQQGNAHAVLVLVRGLSTSKTSTLHRAITEILSDPLPSSGQDALWEVWAVLRLPAVAKILIAKKKQASYRSPAWAISLAKLEKVDSLEAIKPEHLSELLHLACRLRPGNCCIRQHCLDEPEPAGNP